MAAIKLPVDGRVLEYALMFYASRAEDIAVMEETGKGFIHAIEPQDAADLLSLADYLDSPSLVAFAARRVAMAVDTFQELREAGLPSHLRQVVLASCRGSVLFEATAEAALSPVAVDVALAWKARFRAHVHHHRRMRQRMDLDLYMEHGMFGPSSGRDLTLLPPSLQTWYSMVIPVRMYPGRHPAPALYSDCEDDEDDSSDDAAWRGADRMLDGAIADMYQRLRQLFAFFRRFRRPPTAIQLAHLQRELDAGLAALPARHALPREAPRPEQAPTSGAGAGAGAGAVATTRDAGEGAPGGGKRQERLADEEASRSPGERGQRRATRGQRRATRGQRRATRGRARLAAVMSPVRTHMTFGSSTSGLDIGVIGGGAHRGGAADRKGIQRLSRVGGGFRVTVSKPSRIPSSWRSGRKLNLFGKHRSRKPRSAKHPVVGARQQSAHAAAQRRKAGAATIIQRALRRGLRVKSIAAQQVQRTGVLPAGVTPAILQLFNAPRVVSGLVSLLPWCNGLVSLDLRGCRALEPSCMGAIVTLKRLRYLDMSGCSNMGDEAFASLAQLPHLASLQACCWDKLSSRGVLAYCKAAVRNRTCPEVPPINLAHRASHGMAQRLASGQPEIVTTSLRALNLAECRGLDDASVNAIGTMLPGVLDLCVYACLRVTDNGLVGIGSLESRLQRFCWAGAYKVTADGTRFLLSQNPSLLTYSNPNDFRSLRDDIVLGRL